MPHDVVVLGAGPAGLAAALTVARDGGRVVVLEAADRVGGICVTLHDGGLAYDLGGHILFVDDAARRAWLEELLHEDLLWVPRPVASVRDGRIRPGRYLDQRPGEPAGGTGGPSAFDVLTARFGPAFVDREMRRYLEKVDGLPLERNTGQRALKLLVEQAAPEGFHYPAGGIGQLMDAMAEEIRRLGGSIELRTRVTRIAVAGGSVAGVEAATPAGPVTIAASHVVAGLPAALVAGLADPEPPAGVVPTLPPRAAIVVALDVPRDRVSEHAWIQVDDPAVPFARLFEAKNWSDRLVPDGRSVLGCEVYCAPDDGDPNWSRTDADLAAACAAALADPLGLVDDPASVRTLRVVRLPRAWSLVDVDHVAAATAPWNWLGGIGGMRVAQGGDVIRAIAAGEAAV